MNTDGGQQNFSIRLLNEQLRRDAQASIQQFNRIGQSATNAGINVDRSMNNMSKNVTGAIRSMTNGIQTAMADMTKNMLGITALLSSGAFLKNLYDESKAFNREMRVVSTISKDVTRNLEQYKNQVLNLCTELAVAPDTAAQALYQINSAGHLGADGMKVLESSARAAIGGITETAVAADAITTILNAYKMKSEEAEAVSDKLFTTVRLGKTTMDELGRSIAYVAPMAATYKISIDEILAAVAQLTKQGNSTQNAMTQISASIVAVANEMGDEAFKYGLLPALEEIEKRSDGSNLALKAQLSNIRAVRGALGLTKENAKETAQMVEEIKNSAGATAEATEKMNSLGSAEARKLKTNFLKEFKDMGDNMSGTFKSLTQSLNEAFETGEMQTVISVLKDLIVTYGIYKALIITVITLEKARQNVLNQMAYQKAMAATQQIALNNAEAAGAVVTTNLKRAVQALNLALKQNQFGLIVTAIGIAAYAIYKYCTQVTAAEKAQKRLSEATAKAAADASGEMSNIDILISTLKRAKEGTMQYKTAKDAIINQYGKYLEGLIDEKGRIIDLEAAYMRLAQAARESANERALADLTQNADKDYSEAKEDSMKEINNILDSKVKNANLRNTLREMIRRDFDEHGALTSTTQDILGEAFGEKRSKRGKWNDATKVKEVIDQVTDMRAAKSAHDGMLAQANASFGAMTNEYTGWDKDSLIAAKQSLEQQLGAGEIADFIVTQNGRIVESYDNVAEAHLAMQKMTEAMSQPIVEATTKTESPQFKQPEDEEKKKRGDKRQKLNRELEAYEAETQQAQTALMDEGREKRLKIIEDEYNDRLSQIKRQREDWAKENKEAGVKGVGADGLTAEQSKALADRERTAIDQKKKDTAEALKEELSAMRAYLTEYGSIEQQKLAITEEYEQKIRDAKTDGEKLSLAKERDSRLAEANINSITLGIDWNALFSGVGNLSQKMVDPMLKQLQAYVQTDAYKNAGAENQQKVTELIDELRRFSPSFKPETWQELATATANFVEATRSHAQLVEREKDAYSDLEKAKTQLDKGEITQQEYDRVKKAAEDLSMKIVESEKSVRSFGTTLNGVSDSIASGANELTAALNNAKGWKGLDGFSGVQGANDALGAWQADLKNVLAGMQGESLGKTIGTQLSSTVSNALGGMTSGMESILSSGMGSMVGIVAQLPSLILNIVGSIKNMITGALDSLSTLVSFRWVDDLIVGILDSIGNLIDTIFDLPENLYHVFEAVIVDGIGGLFNTIIGRIGNIFSFGALSSKGPADWFTNSNGKWVAETTERLTKSNERLRDSVDRLKDEMSGSYGGWKAIDAARRARDDQQKINDQTMEILIAQMRYHGDHGSNASKWNLGKKDYASLNDTLADYAKKYGKDAKKVNSLADIFGLTPEEMDYIRKHNTTMWSVMLTRGKYDKSQYWEDYADLAGAMDEITDKLKESLTQTTFDSLRGSFVDSLMDMTKDAEAFGEDFTEIMMRSMLNAKISDLLDDQIKAFYDKWAEYAESDNRLTDAEMRELQAMWDAITQQGLDIRDSLAAATGYDKTSANQQGSTGGYKTELSEDTGTLISGRLTALQIAAEKRNTTLESINLDLKAVKERQEQSRDGINEIRDLMYVSIEHLENIEKNTRHLNQMNERLGKIEQNTRNL